MVLNVSVYVSYRPTQTGAAQPILYLETLWHIQGLVATIGDEELLLNFPTDIWTKRLHHGKYLVQAMYPSNNRLVVQFSHLAFILLDPLVTKILLEL